MIIDTDKILPSIYDETKPRKKYVLRLELDNSTVFKIWRGIICPSNIRLSYLSEFLVRTMGFVGYHEHMFTGSDGVEYVSTSLKEDWDVYGPHEGEYRDFNEWTLGDVLQKKGDSAKWTYDLGDNFTHTLTLREVHRYMRRKGVVFDPEYCIIGGENSCPPDDVGGIYGYEHMLEVLKNPGDEDEEEYQEYRDWLPEGFDPKRFNIHDARLRVWDFQRTVETVRMRMEDAIPPEMRPLPPMKRQQSVPRKLRERAAAGGETEN